MRAQCPSRTGLSRLAAGVNSVHSLHTIINISNEATTYPCLSKNNTPMNLLPFHCWLIPILDCGQSRLCIRERGSIVANKSVKLTGDTVGFARNRDFP